MVPIAYKSIKEMPAAARQYTLAHMGELYPMKTLAFFCVMMPRAVYELVGSMDETFGRGFFEDDDYCRRIEQKGFHMACADDVLVHHHLSASFDKVDGGERQMLQHRSTSKPTGQLSSILLHLGLECAIEYRKVQHRLAAQHFKER